MRFSDRLVVVACVAVLFACSSSSVEEPGATEATEGAEALPPPEPQPPPPAPEPAAPPAPAAVEPPPPAAAVTPPPAPQPPPYSAVVIHDVKDYDAWKTAFDADLEARKAAGALGEGVMQGADNDKTVAVYLPATDLDKLKGMLDGKELKDKMKAAGVKGKPTVLIFTSKLDKMAGPDKPSPFGAVLQYNTKDFAAFQTGFEGQDAARTAAGVTGYAVGQLVDKPTTAVVYLQSDDAAKLKAYVGAKETKDAMKAAGVVGQPKATYLKEGPMKMY